MWWQSLNRIRIRTGLAPWIWIRINIETNAYQQNWKTHHTEKVIFTCMTCRKSWAECRCSDLSCTDFFQFCSRPTKTRDVNIELIIPSKLYNNISRTIQNSICSRLDWKRWPELLVLFVLQLYQKLNTASLSLTCDLLISCCPPREKDLLAPRAKQ